jgi:hypothetical protein
MWSLRKEYKFQIGLLENKLRKIFILGWCEIHCELRIFYKETLCIQYSLANVVKAASHMNEFTMGWTCSSDLEK